MHKSAGPHRAEHPDGRALRDALPVDPRRRRKGIPSSSRRWFAGSREFVAGMTRFPASAPVCCSLGGVFTEALKDTAFRAAPLSATEAEEMLTDIRQRRFSEHSRSPAVDLPALAGILQAVGAIALLHPEIARST